MKHDLDEYKKYEDMFMLAYQRHPNNAEKEIINSISYFGSDLNVLRTILSRFDSQTYPTSLCVKFQKSELRLVDFEGASLQVDPSDFAVSGELICKNSYEEHLTKFIKENLFPGMTFVDVYGVITGLKVKVKYI